MRGRARREERARIERHELGEVEAAVARKERRGNRRVARGHRRAGKQGSRETIGEARENGVEARAGEHGKGERTLEAGDGGREAAQIKIARRNVKQIHGNKGHSRQGLL